MDDELRYRRTADLDFLFPIPEAGEDGQLYCRGCHQKVAPGRTRWCSQDCQTNAWIRCGVSSTVRFYVEQRDSGVCAICKLNTKELELLYLNLRDQIRRRDYDYERFCSSRGWWLRVSVAVRECKLHTWGLQNHWWEADHVVPVSEGGGLCGLDGYRTLCLRCHKSETARLRRRLADKRTGQLPLLG